MLGPIGAHIMSVLKVMTPSEIDRYARASEKRRPTAVAAGAEDFDLEDSQTGNPHSGSFKKMTEAEIIPIRPEQNEKGGPPPEGQSSKDPPHSNRSDEELESVGIFSGKKIQDMKNRAEDIAKAAEDSSSVFLIKQRAKLKETNVRMIGNTALKTYAETAHADMTQTEVDLEDPTKKQVMAQKAF